MTDQTLMSHNCVTPSLWVSIADKSTVTDFGCADTRLIVIAAAQRSFSDVTYIVPPQIISVSENDIMCLTIVRYQGSNRRNSVLLSDYDRRM